MDNNGNIVILTGAGISADSGLDTFRGNFGLWGQHKVEDIATPEAFEKNPKQVQKFYNTRRKELSRVTPNLAHQSLAELEQKWPGKVTLVTQNVDDLHERAGSQNVLHMHGKLLEIRCTATGTVFSHHLDVTQDLMCECCKKTGTLRPNIVWFGEYPFDLDTIFSALDEADQFWSIGTSGQVYPAGGFAQHVLMNRAGARMVEFNTEVSQLSHLFSERYEGSASETVPRFVNTLLANIIS
ncbi:MAG: NAD-dependent deacylase [Bdellovibrionota bacterium]